MFARSTSINGAPDAIAAGIAHFCDLVMPMRVDQPGYVGLSMMVDRVTGRCIATTSWASYDAMLGSAADMARARAESAALMGGRASVAEWEIAMMHREHEAREGSWCRVTWFEMAPNSLHTTLDFHRTRALAVLEDMGGFCSASLLINPVTGRGCSTARFDDRQVLADSASGARELREAGVRQVGFQVMDVAELELAIAHLRSPELV